LRPEGKLPSSKREKVVTCVQSRPVGGCIFTIRDLQEGNWDRWMRWEGESSAIKGRKAARKVYCDEGKVSLEVLHGGKKSTSSWKKFWYVRQRSVREREKKKGGKFPKKGRRECKKTRCKGKEGAQKNVRRKGPNQSAGRGFKKISLRGTTGEGKKAPSRKRGTVWAGGRNPGGDRRKKRSVF